MKRPAPGAAAPRVAPSTGVRPAKVPAGASAAAYQDATQQLVAIVSETGELQEMFKEKGVEQQESPAE